MSNSNLKNAKKAKNDEFYTQYVDIEKELQHYNIEGKTIYCNCDNPHYSNFYKYFKDKFNIHKIKHLYCTGYNKDGNGYYAEYNGTEETIKTLNGNGSFDSEECINILKIADVIITNPPFSLFRHYVAQLMEYGKKFLIIGPQNAVTYKEIFPLIKDNKMWWGTDCVRWFIVTEKMNKVTKISYNGETIAEGDRSRWFTNIPHIKQNKPLILTKTYNPIDYPHYDNYDAINVDKVKDIPIDYDGVMGVPITFLDKYCPSQFEIISASDFAVNDIEGWKGVSEKFYNLYYKQGNKGQIQIGWPLPHYIENGVAKIPYKRIFIRKNDSLEPIKFEIADARDYTNIDKLKSKSTFLVKDKDSAINGKPTYARIFIKKNDSLEPIEFEIKGILATNELTMFNGKPKYARILIKRI